MTLGKERGEKMWNDVSGILTRLSYQLFAGIDGQFSNLL
jgi:hypothetical protein